MTTLTGSPQPFNLNANGSISLLIPADAEGIVVSVAGFGIPASTQLFSNLNFLDDSSNVFTLINAGLYAATSYRQIENHLLTTADAAWPGTGEQTLHYAAPDGYSEGFNGLVYYVKDLDVSDPIVDTDTDQGNSVTSPWDSDIAGAGPNDMHVVAAYNYQAAPTVNETGQTEVAAPSVYNNAGIGVAYEQGATSMRVEFVGDLVPTAFVLRSKPAPALTSVDGDDEVYPGQSDVAFDVANPAGLGDLTVAEVVINDDGSETTYPIASSAYIAGSTSGTVTVPAGVSLTESSTISAKIRLGFEDVQL